MTCFSLGSSLNSIGNSDDCIMLYWKEINVFKGGAMVTCSKKAVVGKTLDKFSETIGIGIL